MPRWIAIALLVASTAAGAQMSFVEERAFLRDYIEPTLAKQSEPPTVAPVTAALAAKAYATAESLADAVIAAGGDPGESPQYNAYVRSLALFYRADAKSHDGSGWASVLTDLHASAELGNVRATRALINAYGAVSRNPDAMGGIRPSRQAIARTYAIAADLGMSDGLVALADGPEGDALTPDERLYWRLRANYASSQAPGANGPDFLLRQLVRREGERQVAAALARHALVGAPFAASPSGVPGRDLFATLRAEDQLRKRIAMSLGLRSPRVKITSAPTVLEDFRFQATQAGKSGMAELLLLVPGSKSSAEANIHRMDRQALASEVRSGDGLWVTCGALSHTAAVYDIDRARDVLRLVDANWEFWQSTHNDCVTSFAHEHTSYGFHVLALKWSEVIPLIDAASSFRTAEFVGAAGQGLASLRNAPTRCTPSRAADDLVGVPVDALRTSAFARMFGFEAMTDTAMPNGGRVLTLAPAAVGQHGQAGLVAAVDAEGCVCALSLTIRRSLFEDPATHGSALDMVKALFRYGRVGGVPEAGASEALEAKRRSFEQQAGERYLRIDNLESVGHAPLQRISLQ